MNTRNRKIIKGYVRSATALGVVLGPGIDAAPLAALWLAGVTHLVAAADKHISEHSAKSAIATIVAGFGAWFVSGKIAQIVAGALAAAGLAAAGATFGLGLIAALVATLSLNSAINALFTYRFLNACASVIEDDSHSEIVLTKAVANVITDQLISIAEIPADLVKTFRIMVS